jgi:hypothetical protein
MQVRRYMYHWCKHQMLWTVYKAADCLLDKQHKENQNKKPQKANSAIIASAAAAAMAMNPHFTTLMATLANLKE